MLRKTTFIWKCFVTIGTFHMLVLWLLLWLWAFIRFQWELDLSLFLVGMILVDFQAMRAFERSLTTVWTIERLYCQASFFFLWSDRTWWIVFVFKMSIGSTNGYHNLRISSNLGITSFCGFKVHPLPLVCEAVVTFQNCYWILAIWLFQFVRDASVVKLGLTSVVADYWTQDRLNVIV